MSTPRDFHENGCWKMRCPRSPAKNRRVWTVRSERGEETQIERRSCPGPRRRPRSRTADSWLFAIAAANEVNNLGMRDQVTRLQPGARPARKSTTSTARCASGSRVFLPSRATSRYASQLSNCHASTTCSHSSEQEMQAELVGSDGCRGISEQFSRSVRRCQRRLADDATCKGAARWH